MTPALLAALCVGQAPLPPASDFPKLVEVLPVHSQLLMLHVDEGYVIHHGKGQKRTEEKVVITPLNTALAGQAAAYRLSSSGDPAYRQPKNPTQVNRKSKGTEFAWMVQAWENNMAVNRDPDHAKEHWLYLSLPAPLKEGASYTLNLGGVTAGPRAVQFTFNTARLRSESVHVNLIGTTPDAPSKFGYIYHWAGDKGPVDFGPWNGKPFHVLDAQSRKAVFSGKVAFRRGADNAETFHVSDSPPHGSFLKAPVWECDFSSFAKPGNYVLSVPGIGTSFPFEIGADVYRPVFQATARALYHNRSGIALTQPFTEFVRPAPHNPLETPGFKGRLQYTTVRMQEWGSEGGSKEALEKGFKGPLDTFGWYQDAGDWDSYVSHMRVAIELLFAYEISPRNFRDGELNIPESGNGIPDILDEAAWLPRFGHRLRQELLAKKYGTGGIGLRVAGDAFGSDGEGVPSYLDVDRTWAVSGEDPHSTYAYAGAAAHLAFLLERAGLKDPKGVDWTKEAAESFAWAAANTKPKDEGEVRQPRIYAAAALYRLTGGAQYHDQLKKDTQDISDSTLLWEWSSYGPSLYAMAEGKGARDSALKQRLANALLKTADEQAIATPEKRALRWGGNFSFPMLVGQQTTPWMLETAVAWAMTRESDKAKAERYRSALFTTADYFMGTNALNQTWITGIGERNPTAIFHMDAWYNGKGKYHPGLIPYSPWRNENTVGNGPWSQFWAYKSIHPARIEEWPGNEQWFSNRCSPMGSEFTVHQNIGPAAAFYGLLCAAQPEPPKAKAESKLSIHLLGGRYTPGARQVVQAGPHVLKIFDLHKDMLDAAREYKAVRPDGKTVLRMWHTRKWTLADDPLTAASQYWNEVLAPPLNALSPQDRALIDYVEGPNEGDSTPTWFSLEQAAWFGKFSARLAKLKGEAGFRPVVGCIGVGQPGGDPDEMAAKWRLFFPALEAAAKAGGAWSYHAYTIEYTMDLEKESWYSLRHRRLVDIVRRERPDLAGLTLILTEGGVDFSGNAAKDGWKARGSAEKFQEWLQWFDKELQKDSYVAGITLFQSGDEGLWPSFELEPILPWLAGHIRRSKGA